MRVADGMPAEHASAVARFMRNVGIHGELPERYVAPDSYSDILTASLRSDSIECGRVTCSLTVEPSLLNTFGGLHGGAIAAIAERVSTACARTVVDGDLFLSELGMSYLSSATQNTELTVEGSIIGSRRNVTMVVVDFKIRETGKLVYTASATLYAMPTAKL